MPTTNQESLASFMDDLQNAMAKFMVEFESDQVLMQMRNDPLLYDLKLARIKELIREEFPQKEQMMELALSSN